MAPIDLIHELASINPAIMDRATLGQALRIVYRQAFGLAPMDDARQDNLFLNIVETYLPQSPVEVESAFYEQA